MINRYCLQYNDKMKTLHDNIHVTHSCLTGIYDVDKYLMRFLIYQSLIKLTLINKNIYSVLRSTDVYKQLVEIKDIKSIDQKLEYCIKFGYLKVIKLYIRSQFIDINSLVPIDIDLVPIDINSLITTAASLAQLKILMYLVSHASITINLNNALRMASKNGHLPIIKYLVSLGASVDASVNGNDSVVWASMNGHLDVVKYFMQFGASVTYMDNHAIRNASEYGHLELVKYLVSVGAVTTDNYAVRYALLYNHVDVINYLNSL